MRRIAILMACVAVSALLIAPLTHGQRKPRHNKLHRRKREGNRQQPRITRTRPTVAIPGPGTLRRNLGRDMVKVEQAIQTQVGREAARRD
jgi:hypothetical protein